VYFVFLILVVALYWRVSFRKQNVVLLIASYYFYGWWDWRFLALMAGSTLADFFIARAIAGSAEAHRRKLLLVVSLVLNFGFLGFFKYYNFFVDSLATALHALGVQRVPTTMLQILLPPGISFYTFQEVAYIVDVYKRRLEPAKNLVDYALFISLFPHLIAGPIQRPNHLLPQVQQPRRFDDERFFGGMLLILSGLFRKCVVADNCALLANAVFNGDMGKPNLFLLLIGTWAFAWQIYGDFSGYSDIARGSAQLLGFHFMVNFRQPYLAKSLQDFWHRWHISLSTWLRDYLYIALGGNRRGRLRTYANLMATMLLGGLWHGANWTFVIWGGIHGAVLAVERFVQEALGARRRGDDAVDDRPSRVGVWLRRIFIFHLVCMAWVFFRASSVGEAAHLIAGAVNVHWEHRYFVALKLLVLVCTPLFLVDLYLERSGEEYPLERRAPLIRVAYAVAMLTLTTMFAANNEAAFIYFRF
ncbi:MAG TPA: MBOAT family protein, partial [Polyangia bacterium]|nr:MBOAT family protein [Polyangia bacterium]